MRATLKKINEFIEREYPGMDITLYKGVGYFYFDSESEIESIYVNTLREMSLEQWVESVADTIDRAIAEQGR